MRGRKRILAGLMMLLFLASAGCGGTKPTSADYQRGNKGNRHVYSIMKAENGYYYGKSGYNSSLELHYYDSKNGRNMYLCNKPECRHDGNEFCAATSDRYNVTGMVLYGDDIYINAVERTGTAYQFKLLRASGDGSSLSEVTTYFETDNKERLPGYLHNLPNGMTIHKNKAFLTYSLFNPANRDIGVCGTAIYDLQTGELTYLGEKDMDFTEVDINFCGCGDYMYFVRSKGSRKQLYRYSYSDGSLEKIPLKNNFRGQYALYDENTCFYIKDGGDVYLYKHDTGESRKVEDKEWIGVWLDIQTKEGVERRELTRGAIESLLSDGEYVYVAEQMSFDEHFFTSTSYIREVDGEMVNLPIDYGEVIILDKEGRLVNEVKVGTKELLGYNEYFTLHFTEDTVYMQTSVMVYECSKADFVAGNANFKEAYPLDVDIISRKEKAQ